MLLCKKLLSHVKNKLITSLTCDKMFYKLLELILLSYISANAFFELSNFVWGSQLQGCFLFCKLFRLLSSISLLRQFFGGLFQVLWVIIFLFDIYIFVVFNPTFQTNIFFSLPQFIKIFITFKKLTSYFSLSSCPLFHLLSTTV